jgi:integrase
LPLLPGDIEYQTKPPRLRFAQTAQDESGLTVEGGVIWHDLRRTFATELRGRQVRKYDIADLLGHTIQSVRGTYVGREFLLSYFVRFQLLSSTRRYIELQVF